MDRDDARRVAANIVLTATTQPDFQFTDDQLQSHGADGPSGQRELTNGLADVARGLGADVTEAHIAFGNIATVNALIALCTARLQELGGDASKHLSRIVSTH